MQILIFKTVSTFTKSKNYYWLQGKIRVVPQLLTKNKYRLLYKVINFCC